MAQHDMNIANQGFPGFRADLNNALAALVSNSSGATAPATTFAHQLWVDTSANPSILKIRNADNDAFITIGEIDQTGDKFNLKCANATILENLTVNAQGDVRFADSDSSHFIAFQAPATVTSNVTFTLPAADGTSGQALTTNGSGVLSFAAGSPDGGFSFRNRIINGDMRIAQRGTAAVTTSGSFAVDRFLIQIATDGAYSAQQDSDAPTGFIKSTKITTTTADASLSASQFFQLQQRIEGTNTADLAWGSASAKTVTLSFFVKSSLTGTFGGALGNDDFNRSYPFTYTISVADTFEYKTIEIEGDTSGTWKTDNNVGINVRWGLGVGSNFSGTADAWTGSGLMSATGAVSVIGTLNATWFVTGVQLEVGSVATPFERRPFGGELALCQRYFYRLGTGTNQPISLGYNRATTRMDTFVFFPVTMRASPTGTVASGTNFYSVDYSQATTNMNDFTADLAYPQGARLINTGLVGLTAASGCVLLTNNASANVGFSAEL